MKSNILLSTLILLICPSLWAQQQYKIDEDTYIFYPAKFDSSAQFPSFALEKEWPVIKLSSEKPKIIPEFYIENGKACAKINIPKEADLYGTGEVSGALKRNNKTVVFWNKDNYTYSKAEGKRLYQSHPWVLGVNKDGSSFGILIDNTWKHEMHLDNPIEIISDGPPFRVILIEKKSPQEVLKTLAKLTGTMDLPPLWTLGFQQCRFSYYPDSVVRNLANTFRQKQIPCDVIWMDIDYMDGFRIFTFDSLKFPNPKDLNNYLHKKNFKAVWMIDPGVKKDEGYFVYDQGTQKNLWTLTDSGAPFIGKVWPGDCVFPDFTMQDTREWWGDLYKDYMAMGIDGVWNDMNEPSVFNGPDGSMPATNQHHGDQIYPAGPHLRYHNVYGYLMVKSSREGILKTNPDKRPFILSRSNFIGGQRYAATWTGDNASSFEHMKLSIPMSLNLSLSGQPFNGPDIGGYAGDATGELVAQWMAIGAFFPFCRNHDDGGEVWQEPWAFGIQTEQVSRIALERRYRLLPYLYTLFYEASTDGMPVMRPAFFADLTDMDLRDEQDAFLLGEDLLVIPKWNTSPHLPHGDWRVIDLVGENSEKSKYHPDLLIKNGAILPAGNIVQNTEGYKTDSLTLYISLDESGTAKGYIYADNGVDFAYKKNDYLITQFTAQLKNKKELLVETIDKEGNYKINRTYKIALVTPKGIRYSDWLKGTELYINLKKMN